MASAVAFAFIVSLFPFCIFLGASRVCSVARARHRGGQPPLSDPSPAVAGALMPQVENIMGHSRIDLLTVGGFLALFFATSALETLRAALNGAYRVHETRPYPVCLGFGMLLVFVSAASMLVLTWTVVVGPGIAARFEPSWAKDLLDSTWLAPVFRYGLAAAVIGAQLFAFHLWLAAGKRRVADVWPGVALSVVLWLTIASFYSYYLNFSDYARFYAGLSQLMRWP